MHEALTIPDVKHEVSWLYLVFVVDADDPGNKFKEQYIFLIMN